MLVRARQLWETPERVAALPVPAPDASTKLRLTDAAPLADDTSTQPPTATVTMRGVSVFPVRPHGRDTARASSAYRMRGAQRSHLRLGHHPDVCGRESRIHRGHQSRICSSVTALTSWDVRLTVARAPVTPQTAGSYLAANDAA